MTIEIEDSEEVEEIEPLEYFQKLKGSVKLADNEQLRSNIIEIEKQIIDANDLGQESFLHQLAFSYDTIFKEQELVVNGIDRYVYAEDVENLIEKTKGKIKIIELERYPRVIPEENRKQIIEAKNLDLFDGFVVVFTDLTGNDYKTPQEKEYVSRNRDPIVFGYFCLEGLHTISHDRLYFITDWEDEYCDLTFTKMIQEMSKHNVGKDHTIQHDTKYIQEIANSTLEKLKKSNKPEHMRHIKKYHSVNFIHKILSFFKKKT